eukprot:TRINITY_DN16953_c0_g1_i2.p1 TRINITY_DN16953_c0_g1~~TRINITY_DN16953_c0_g1_i2.p1  ORF type:complete len:201 (+),score=-3.01 TRINITY_DN16953_c0_g1_i2:191-793(+)
MAELSDMSYDKNDLIIKHRIKSSLDNGYGTVEISVENRSIIAINSIIVHYNILNSEGMVENKWSKETYNISSNEIRIIFSHNLYAHSKDSVKVTEIAVTAADGTSFLVPPPSKFTYNRCFVTTAAYGDDNHPMVMTFRSMRDEVLVNHKTGRIFINWYNREGPELADMIVDRPLLRAGARVVLTPLALTIKAIRSIAGYF